MSLVFDESKALVNERFNLSTQYSEEAWDLASEFINDLRDTVTRINTSFADIKNTYTPPDSSVILATPPQAPAWSINDAIAPSPVELNETIFTDIATPIFTGQLPEINIPELPDTDIDTKDIDNVGLTKFISDLHNIKIPNAPALEYPGAPTLKDIVIPALPSFTKPIFNYTPPNATLNPPATIFFYDEQAYASDLLNSLKENLANSLQVGGTGLGADVEEALWDRMRARQEVLHEQKYNEVIASFAARGWIRPPGALTAAMRELSREQARADALLNNEITIEQAELALKNAQFTISTIVDLEKALLAHSDAVNNRALEAAKATQDAALKVFEAHIACFNAKWDGYAKAANVYAEMIRAETLAIEAYRAQMEGIKIVAQTQELQVNLYQAKMNALKVRSELYLAAIEAAKTEAELDKIKIDAFLGNVKIFEAKVNAVTAKLNVWQAQMAGQKVLQEIYDAQVKSYGVQIESYKAQIESQNSKATAIAHLNSNLIQQYQADVDAYKARYGAEIAKADTMAKMYNADVQAFEAQIKNYSAKIMGNIESNKLNVQNNSNLLQLALKQAEVNIKAAEQTNTLRIEAIKAGANVSAQLAASALSGIHAQASMGFSGSYGESTTHVLNE